jgi:hypothetical protein
MKKYKKVLPPRKSDIGDPNQKVLACEGELNETLPASADAGDYIHDFVHSKNKVFKGDSKKQRIHRALGAYYSKKRGK